MRARVGVVVGMCECYVGWVRWCTNSYLLFQQVEKQLSPPPPKWRRASFATRVCAQGCFPIAYKIPYPVVQGVMTFATMPSRAAIIALLREKLLFFSRFRSVPEFDGHGLCVGWKNLQKPADVKIEDHFVDVKLPTRAAAWQYIDKVRYFDLAWVLSIVLVECVVVCAGVRFSVLISSVCVLPADECRVHSHRQTYLGNALDHIGRQRGYDRIFPRTTTCS